VKRIRGWALNILVGLSLLLCIMTCVFWHRSSRTSDVLSHISVDPESQTWRCLRAASSNGGIQFEDYRVIEHQPMSAKALWDWQANEPRQGFHIDHGEPYNLPDWTPRHRPDVLGGWHRWPTIEPRRPTISTRDEVFTGTFDIDFTNICRGIVMPYWLPFTATALLPTGRLLIAVYTRRQRARLRRVGFCPVWS
jgi:hypothetical protein